MIKIENRELLQALARCTRFNPLQLSKQELVATPLSHGWNALIRGIMGLAYALLGAFVMLLFRNALPGAIIATVLALLLHSYLTNGRENSLPLALRNSMFPNAGEMGSALTLLFTIIPPALFFYIFFSGNGYWLPAIFAFGAAAGGSISGKCATQNDASDAQLPAQMSGWYTAAAVAFVTMVLFVIASPCRTRHFVFAVALSVFMLLICPWLKRIPGRIPGFTANTFLCEIVAALFAFLATAL